uniref:Zinc/iron permease n=1 Tax=Syphacia muris TaxID=451379 RepID=A0A0N5AUW7_9BILA
MLGHVTLQLIFAAIMFAFTAIPGFASIKVTNRVRGSGTNKSSLPLSLLSCFTGGVFLATCFLDLIPHATENFETFKQNSSWKSTFPLAELLMCIGFFAVYALEEIMDVVFSNRNSKNNEYVTSSELIPKYQTPDEVALNAIYGAGVARRDQQGNSQQTRKNKEGSVFRAMVLVIVMSFHSILEGFALGVQTNYSDAISLFISLILHKGIESFSVGLQIARAGTDRKHLVITTIFIYALMTPIGSIAAVSIWNLNFNNVVKGGVIVVLECLAIGTFIYATFLEIIAVERANEHSNFWQMVVAGIGLTLIALFQVGEAYMQASL